MNNILGLKNRIENCTGCRVCEHVCPKKCIILKNNNEGFLYPSIDENMCVECGACVKKCHAIRLFEKTDINNLSGFCAWASDELRQKSSSGGVFSAIIDSLESEYDIFGAAFTEDMLGVHHIKCSKDNYALLRKSKYVISDLDDIFFQIKHSIQEKRKVLFTGTPCQVAALKTYLGNAQDGLLTIDMICHGVPSETLYKDYLSLIANGRDIVLVDFRPKGNGWNARFRIYFDNGESYIADQEHDWYLYHYFHNHSMRKCCYHCAYTSTNHQSDITLADFWGAKEYNAEYMKQPGVALVVCNTSFGKNIYEKLNLVVSEELTADNFKYAYNNGHEWYSLKDREEFFYSLEHSGLARRVARFNAKRKILDIAVKCKRIIITFRRKI